MALSALQSKLLEMLTWFHGYCLEHNLRYYLIGGSALGAARHQGFIPWDDDIDVGMPREDYEKLRSLQAEHGKYLFEFPSEKKDFVYAYGKLYDRTTTLIEHTRYKTKRGIFIDIFPLDGLGNSYEESLARFKEIDKKVNLLSTRTCALRKGRRLYKNLAIIAMRLVPSFLLSRKKLVKEIEELSKARSFDECAYVANCVGAWHEKEIVKRTSLGKPTEAIFEGITLFVPEDIDGFLTGIYGDWRTPPPPEKQISHHDYLALDLEKAY